MGQQGVVGGGGRDSSGLLLCWDHEPLRHRQLWTPGHSLAPGTASWDICPPGEPAAGAQEGVGRAHGDRWA